jgi:dTDP-4-amino-4,6-dideoxygalactose transaminase
VHYFGKPCGGVKARSFCDEINACLIEDAAHASGPIDDIGRYGDFIFYSPYKIFPVPDGAVLLVRDLKVVDSITQIISSLPSNAPSSWSWRVKRLLQKILPESFLKKLARARRPNFENDAPLATLAPTPRLSLTARRMLSNQGARMGKIAMARKSNAEAIRAKINASPDSHPLFDAALEGSSPYRFPIRYRDQERARDLFEFLSEKGCPIETWPDLPPEVSSNPEAHAQAIELRMTTVFLPVHQSADTDQLTECLSVDECA